MFGGGIVKLSKKWLVVGLVTAVNIVVLGVPAAVAIASGQSDKLQLYVKALQYGFKGFQEYLSFIVDLFKAAIGV